MGGDVFPDPLQLQAGELVTLLQGRGLRIVTAESCTGGLIAAVLTEIPGSSAVVDRGFITYSNDAKVEMLGVRAAVIAEHGVVSRAVALAMAEGAIVHSAAEIAVAVTGIAGPGGGSIDKPVGLVHIAAARIGQAPLHRECRFTGRDRSAIRLAAVATALSLVQEIAGDA